MNPGLKGVGDGDVILLDTVPLIRHILCPHIRSVSEHLMSRTEKANLEHTVTVMADLGLNYSQIQVSEGNFKYQLEPDLNHIAQFPGVPKETMNHWTCQLVSKEVQEEYIRRATPKISTQKSRRIEAVEGSKEKENEVPMEQEVDQDKLIEPATTSKASKEAGNVFQKPAVVLRPANEYSNVKEVVSNVLFLILFQ